MWGAHEGMGWWMLIGSVWFFVFWGFVMWLLVSVFGRSDRGSRHDGESALDIARKRYARGELSREEFERLRQDLG